MNGNIVITELINSFGYNYKLGDKALIEGDSNISTLLNTIFNKFDISMDMACGDCSGNVTNFNSFGNGDISFYATDNQVEYLCRLNALFVITNSDDLERSPHIFLMSEKKKLPKEAQVQICDSFNNFEFVTGVILKNGSRSFNEDFGDKRFNSLEDPDEIPISFKRIKSYSYKGTLAYMNIQGMDFQPNPLDKTEIFTVESLRTLKDIVNVQ